MDYRQESRMRSLPVGIVLAIIGLGLAGRSLVSAEPADKPTLALLGGRISDGDEGRPIDGGVVWIAGERIVAVGPRSQVTVPAGIATIDTRGMSVLPGLSDMHVHLMIVG